MLFFVFIFIADCCGFLFLLDIIPDKHTQDQCDKTLSDGTETTTEELLEKAGLTADFDELFVIHSDLCDATEKAFIDLDFSKHYETESGLMFRLDFIIYTIIHFRMHLANILFDGIMSI